MTVVCIVETLKSLSLAKLSTISSISELYCQGRPENENIDLSLLPVAIVRDHLPKPLYREYLELLMGRKIKSIWHKFVREVLQCKCLSEIYNFNFRNITVEQWAALKFYPYNTFSLPNKSDCPFMVAFFYATTGGCINTCLQCCKKFNFVDGTVCNKVYFLYPTDMPDLFHLAWCELCKTMPLFRYITDSDDLYFNVEDCSFQIKDAKKFSVN